MFIGTTNASNRGGGGTDRFESAPVFAWWTVTSEMSCGTRWAMPTPTSRKIVLTSNERTELQRLARGGAAVPTWRAAPGSSCAWLTEPPSWTSSGDSVTVRAPS